jgi:hypothetical protein
VSERLSRGEIISLITGIPAALAVTAGAASAAADTPAATAMKKSLGYIDKSTTKGRTCSNCRFYKGINGTTGTCQIIPGGTVKAAGWCKSWAAKA